MTKENDIVKYIYTLEVEYPNGTQDSICTGEQDAAYLGNLLKKAHPELDIIACRQHVFDFNEVIEEIETELNTIKFENKGDKKND